MVETVNYMGLDGFAWFVGVVEDRNDPEQLGRVRVRCLGWHTEDLSALPTAELPWAHVMHPVTDPSMHGMGTTPSFLLEGGWVVGFFRDTEYQQPVIIGTLPGVPLNPADHKRGFNDPRHMDSTQTNFAGKKQYAKEDKDGKVYNPGEGGGTIEDYNPAYSQQSYGPYPLGGDDGKGGKFSRSSGHTIKESDTNRLARNGGHNVLSSKDIDYDPETAPQGRTKDVFVALYEPDAEDGNDIIGNKVGNKQHTVDASRTVDSINTDVNENKWVEPSTTSPSSNGNPRYDTKYPYNHVFETESGHIKEYDDTPNAERIHEYHKSGTFYEIDTDGNKQTRIVGNNYEVIAGTNFVNVKGDVNLTIDSNCKTYIKGDWDIQVDGNKTELIKGSHSKTVNQNHTEVVSGTQTSTIAGAVTESYSSSLNTTIVGTTGILHQDVATYHYVDDFKEKIDKDHYIDKEGGKVDHTHPVSPPRTSGEEPVEGLLEIDDVL